jgi:hypothetical protein
MEQAWIRTYYHNTKLRASSVQRHCVFWRNLVSNSDASTSASWRLGIWMLLKHFLYEHQCSTFSTIGYVMALGIIELFSFTRKINSENGSLSPARYPRHFKMCSGSVALGTHQCVWGLCQHMHGWYYCFRHSSPCWNCVKWWAWNFVT